MFSGWPAFVRVGRPRSEDLPEPLGVYRRGGVLAGPSANERRADAIDEILASSLRTKQRDDHDLLVGVLDGIYDDRLAVTQICQDLLNPVRPTDSNVGQCDRGDLVAE